MQKDIQGLDGNAIQIVCCTDHNYVMPCGVMLKSLFVNNDKLHIHIHLIVDNTVDEHDKDSIKRIVTFEHNGELTIYNADEIQFQDYPQLGSHTHISKAAYYRLFMTKFLPATLDKVIYLDDDLIVLKSIKALWDYDIQDYPIAAVIDPETDDIRHYNRMEYASEDRIINSGVMIINLRYWRENELPTKFLELISNYPQRIKFHDQDILNCVLHGKILILPINYNVQSAFFYRPNLVLYDIKRYKSQVDAAKKEPVILHFSSKAKPWHEDCFHPLRSEFVKYQDMTEWKGVIYELKPQRITLRNIVGAILRYLGIRKTPKFYMSKNVFEHESAV